MIHELLYLMSRILCYFILCLCDIDVMYVNHGRYIQYMHACLIGTLSHEKKGKYDLHHKYAPRLKLWDLMHFVCHEHRDTFPL